MQRGSCQHSALEGQPHIGTGAPRGSKQGCQLGRAQPRSDRHSAHSTASTHAPCSCHCAGGRSASDWASDDEFVILADRVDQRHLPPQAIAVQARVLAVHLTTRHKSHTLCPVLKRAADNRPCCGARLR
jgi:hypothetical protein